MSRIGAYDIKAQKNNHEKSTAISNEKWFMGIKKN
jgi:hypothetical protein